eukprot:Nitzschia sp. Nitz4//scaffold63_size106090//11063//13423//NITZ4_004379-RA/size106090-processed-gene-0.117-mRNA-1//1//CDS//3329555942//4017//frame0
MDHLDNSPASSGVHLASKLNNTVVTPTLPQSTPQRAKQPDKSHPNRSIDVTPRKVEPEKPKEKPPKKEEDKPKNNPKILRPNFKPKPHGHGVQPDLFLGTPDVNDNGNKSFVSSSRQQSVPPDQVLTAYLEPIDQDLWDSKPLPRRTTTSGDLTRRPFPQLNSCSRLTEQWPVDNYPDEDPFLPWIHDVFPTVDGKFLQFVAQNKRRCHTGYTEEEEAILKHMAPQVALFQHVPLQRIQNATEPTGEPRFRLSTHEEADPESISTRFICRFKPSGDITFSTFNNEYEYAAFRKRQRRMFQEDGRDNKVVQTAQLLFQCPIPEHLVDVVRDGTSVQDDWATLFVDLIPIRTPPRYGPPEKFLDPRLREGLPQSLMSNVGTFDALQEWGKDHVLPLIEDSGRWTNIPICRSSLQEYHPAALEKEYHPVIPNDDNPADVKHRLISCLWASAGYTTRGERYAINDGQRRLVEWVTFNKMLGFDHFYIYDNSAAFTNTTSLDPVARLFPDDITIIKWPSRVCNNRPNNVDSPGDRSSQYAAESSCRLRFGPHTEWIGQFDMDEYLVPMGNYTTGVLPLLDKLDKDNTKAISFASWRAWPRMTHINPPENLEGREYCDRGDKPCFELSIRNDTTYLEGYNCDRFKPGQKGQVMPAEKQLYRPDYVTQHFVHYSTITKTTLLPYLEFIKKFGSKGLAPDPLTRFGDEVNEGLMLHSKAIARQDTTGWMKNCHANYSDSETCRIGFPWPEGEDENSHKSTHDANGWLYNCFVNGQIDNHWGPLLQGKLKERGFM